MKIRWNVVLLSLLIIIIITVVFEIAFFMSVFVDPKKLLIGVLIALAALLVKAVAETIIDIDNHNKKITSKSKKEEEDFKSYY